MPNLKSFYNLIVYSVPLYTFAEDSVMNAPLLVLCSGNKVFGSNNNYFNSIRSIFSFW